MVSAIAKVITSFAFNTNTKNRRVKMLVTVQTAAKYGRPIAIKAG